MAKSAEEKRLARQLAETNRIIAAWTREARRHGGVLPAMWLDRGYVIRCNSWLDDRWGGGRWWEVAALEFDPPHNLNGDRFRGYVRIQLRAERYNIEETHQHTVLQSDCVELLRPRIATPTQWRLRCGC